MDEWEVDCEDECKALDDECWDACEPAWDDECNAECGYEASDAGNSDECDGSEDYSV